MPQPTVSQVHIQAALTQMSVAYAQTADKFIAERVFPLVSVRHQADKYWKYSKDDFFRDDAQKRANATESVGSGFNLSTDSYMADVWAIHMDVGEQVRDNADPGIDMDISATNFVTNSLLIRRDREFSSSFLKTGLWATDVVGTLGGTPGTATPPFWNDDVNGDPFTDISVAQTAMLQNTGAEANVLLMTYPVYQGLRKHPLVVDRIKYTTRADASRITPELMAAAFDIDKVVVSKAVYNSSAEGVTGSYSFMSGKNALLMHVAPSPGLMMPSAGYIFAWSGFTNLNNIGIRVSQIPLPWLGLGTVRIEAEMAFAFKVVGADLGYYFSGIVT